MDQKNDNIAATAATVIDNMNNGQNTSGEQNEENNENDSTTKATNPGVNTASSNNQNQKQKKPFFNNKKVNRIKKFDFLIYSKNFFFNRLDKYLYMKWFLL